MNKVLFLLLLFLQPLSSFAHSHHENMEDLVKVQEQLLATMIAYLHTPTSSYDEMGTINFRGKQIPVNISAMKQLAAIASFHDQSTDHHHCSHECQKNFLGKIGKLMNKLASLPRDITMLGLHPIKAINSVKNRASSLRPFQPKKIIERLKSTFSHYKSATINMIKGTSRSGVSAISQYYHGYSPTLFVIIVVSQSAWETLETILMPGIHVACTIFNSALLTGTTLSERLYQLASFPSTNLPLKTRILRSITGFKDDLTFSFHNSKTTNYSSENSLIKITRKNYLPKHETDLENQLRTSGFYDSVYVSKEMSPGSHEVNLLADIDFLFDPTKDQVERFFVASSFISGIKKQIKLSQIIASQLAKQGAISTKSLWEVNKVAGYMRANTALLSNSLLLIASLQSSEIPEHLKSRTIRNVEHNLLLFRKTHELFSNAIELSNNATPGSEQLLNNEARAVSQLAKQLKYKQTYLRAGKRPYKYKLLAKAKRACGKIFL